MFEVVWHVVADRPARVFRRCSRCDLERPFASSGRFRVNAQKRRLDVWLIYRCQACDDVWNSDVVRRATPESIGPERLRAFHDNDPEAAWAFAAESFDPEQAYRVERERPGPCAPFTIVFDVPRRCRVRLDRLIAGELGLPRAALRELRGHLVHGLRVTIPAPAPRAGEARPDPPGPAGPPRSLL